MTKITKREMYEALLAEKETGEVCKFATEDVIAFFQNEIDLLDKKAAKAKARAATKAAEGDALAALVKDALTDELQTIADITAKVAESNADATISKVTYRLSQLVKNAEAVKGEVTIPGGEGVKARKVVAYSIA